MDETPTHKAFAVWLAAQMAARGFNRSDLARLIWGTVPDTRGYDVAKNRDRIGAYLRGNSYPGLHTSWKLQDIFDAAPGLGLPEDMPGPGKPQRMVKQHAPGVSPMTQINQKLDRILAILER
jgi:hypothetical protein